MPINEINFFNDPFKALNDLIAQINDERAPYLVNCIYIKTECNTIVILHDGNKKRILKTKALFVPSQIVIGAIVKVDSRNFLND